MKWISAGVVSFFLATFALYAQEMDEGQYSLFRSKTSVKNPLDLRDPFKRRVNRRKSQTQIKSKNNLDGIYTNIVGSLDNKPLESLRVVGIVLGAERRAMIKVAGNSAGATPDGSSSLTDSSTIYYIKEGMKIGENNAEVKAILPGGIVLVEKIRNVYDQDEYLETVIPVSND